MLDRLRVLLLTALTALTVLLAALVVLGTAVLPAVRPLPYPATEGSPVVEQRGSGTGASGSLTLRGDAIGFSIACDPGSRATVEVQDVGIMEMVCDPRSSGGIVLSDVVTGRHPWRLTVAPAARWSMVLSAPIDDGTGDITP